MKGIAVARARQILFIQGGGAGVHDEWDDKLVASLRRELGSDYEVRYPRMPDEGDPSYNRWSTAIRREMAALDDDAVVVGHSVGATVLVNALAEQPPEKRLGAISTIAREPFPRRLLSQRSDQDGRARRMAGHDRTIIQGRQLPPDRRAPPGITRVALSRQARAADLAATAGFPAAGSRPACHPTGRARPRRRPG